MKVKNGTGINQIKCSKCGYPMINQNGNSIVIRKKYATKEFEGISSNEYTKSFKLNDLCDHCLNDSIELLYKFGFITFEEYHNSYFRIGEIRDQFSKM